MRMNINLKKYKDPKEELVDGELVYYDKIKNVYRPAHPEEYVRQKFIEYLHDKLDIPYDAMLTEEILSHHGVDDNRRMDICVERDTVDGHKIVLVVECKQPDIQLTDEVYAQAKGYAEELDIPVLMLTNGYELDCIIRTSTNTYEDVTQLPDYERLADYQSIKTLPIVEYVYDRWSYEELFDENVHEIERDLSNFIFYDTEESLIPITLNLAECFLDVTHRIDSLPLKTYEFVNDDGIYYKKASNPVFSFYSNSRMLRVKDENDNMQSIGFNISIDGRPTIFVGKNFNGKYHNALELGLNRNMKVNGDEIIIFHDGKSSIGKNKMLSYVKDKQIFEEDENGNIILGKLDVSNLLYCDSSDVKELMANLIEYAILRDECREKSKNN